MIRSFRDKTTEDIFHNVASKAARKFPQSLHAVAFRKLDQLDTAAFLEDLACPPGNHLEALKGNLQGFHSIRINDQWRIIFRWNNGLVDDVQIVDYH